MSITFHEPPANADAPISEQPDMLPWMAADSLPRTPQANTYGYMKGKQPHSCAQAELIEQLQHDTNKQISLVWEPDSTYVTLPEALPWLFDAIRTREQAYLKHLRFLDRISSVGALQLIMARWFFFGTTHSRLDDVSIVQSAIRTGE